jgi:Ca-activated chloride channel family protein
MVLLVVVAATVAASAQDPQQHVFRAGVQTVPIYATVVDSNNRLVPDLKQEDFELFDNGKPVPITLFVTEVQPIAVVIAIDTSGSMTLVLDRVKDAAEAFILRLMPKDRAMIVNFDDKVVAAPGFTGSRDQLVQYLRTKVEFGNGTHLWDAMNEGVARVKAEPERKVVLVLSDGQDEGSRTGSGEVLTSAQDAHVMVYVIGMRNRYFNGQQWTISTPDRSLHKLTAETGGGNFEIAKADDLNKTFTRVADELHRQYLIGMEPAVLDGKLHKLELRAKPPGMVARARQSYIATKN